MSVCAYAKYGYTYTLRSENIEEGLSHISESGIEDVPNSNIGKSEGNSSNSVRSTALS